MSELGPTWPTESLICLEFLDLFSEQFVFFVFIVAVYMTNISINHNMMT